MSFAFEKLLVYQKAVAFADSVCTLTREFPRGYFFLADQMNRAALSAAANIAEGNGRFTKPDRKNFFGIARGSVQECVPLLELAVRQKLLAPEGHQQMKANLEETARMLSGLIKGLESRQARGWSLPAQGEARHMGVDPLMTRQQNLARICERRHYPARTCAGKEYCRDAVPERGKRRRDSRTSGQAAGKSVFVRSRVSLLRGLPSCFGEATR
jgi:four helix bundle protein